MYSENHLQIIVDQYFANNRHRLLFLDINMYTFFLFSFQSRVLFLYLTIYRNIYFSVLIVSLYPFGWYFTVISDIETSIYFFIKVLYNLFILDKDMTIPDFHLLAQCQIMYFPPVLMIHINFIYHTYINHV